MQQKINKHPRKIKEKIFQLLDLVVKVKDRFTQVDKMTMARDITCLIQRQKTMGVK